MFKFSDGGLITGALSGGGGNNTLDYSPRTTAIVVNLQTNAATSIGGGYTAIQSFVGGHSVADQLIGLLNSANTFNITGPNSGTVNGASDSVRSRI